ncbi:ABC transporter permease subunit [bacterium]|nr:ABC transporter permease subunit [bacterium]
MTNPIIQREVISKLRTKSTFIGLGVFLCLCAVSAISWWGQVRAQTIYSGGYGSSITQILTTVGSLFILLWAPMMGAVAICQERENGSWEMLLASPTNLLSILFAKMVAPLIMIVLFLFALLPIIFLGMPFGGTSAEQIILLLITYMEMALQCIVIGMLCSAVSRHAVQAISAAFLITFAWLILVPLISQIMLRTTFFASLGPFFIYQEYLAPGSTSSWIPNPFKPYAIPLHCIFVFILFGGLFLFTLRRSSLHRTPSKFQIRKRFFPFFQTKRKKRELPPFPDTLNPVYVREMRERLNHNRWSLIISILSFALFSIVLTVFVPRSRFGNGSFELLALFFIPFMILPGAVYALKQERDRGLWDLLVTTNIKPRQIINAKAYINFVPFVLRMGAFLIFWLWTAHAATRNNGAPSYLALSSLPFTIFFTALFLQQLGMYISIICKKTITAFGIMFGFTSVLYLGGIIFMQLFFSPVSLPIRDYHNWVQFFSIASPFYLYITSSQGNVYLSKLIMDEWYNWMGIQAFWMGGAALIFYILTQTTLQRESYSSRL